MFELNLIKDKAKARQRRRIIFLTITSVVFLAALSSMFVVSLYLKELTDTRAKEREVALQQSTLDNQKKSNDDLQPKVKKRRNGLIMAWEEDRNFVNKRPYYTPVLNLLATEKPNAQFWYSNIEFRVVTAQITAGNVTPGVPQLSKVLAPRSLNVTGMINITESDIQTQKQLDRMTDHMNSNDLFVGLVGPARADLQVVTQDQGAGQGGGEATRWNAFEISASRAGAGLGP